MSPKGRPSFVPPLRLPETLAELFEPVPVPEAAFLVKDPSGRFVAVNQSRVARLGRRHQHELLGC